MKQQVLSGLKKVDYYQDLVFWRVEDLKFFNKMSALKYLISRDLPREALEFCFFDAAFGAFDWSKAPTKSYDELLRERCLQLRSKYDYLRLWYSGGPDSHTMLKAFLRHGIPLDEIILYRCSVSDNFESATNREINESALPFLQSIRTELGKTRITVLDLGCKEYEKFFAAEDWPYRSNILRFRPYCRSFFYDCFPQLWEPVLAGQKHVNIIGKEKPRLARKEGEYFHFYWDGMIAAFVGAPFVEYFFVTPELPELHCKQLHLTKKYFQDRPELLDPIDPEFRLASLSWLNKLCRDEVYRNIMFEKTGEIISPKSTAAMDEGREFAPSVLEMFLRPLEKENKVHTWRFNGGSIFNDICGISSRKFSLGF